MTELNEVPEYSDPVTETLLSSKHPDAKWLADNYVTVLDYATDPSPSKQLEKQYKTSDRALDEQGVVLRALLNREGSEPSDHYDDAMYQVDSIIWKKLLDDRSQRLAA